MHYDCIAHAEQAARVFSSLAPSEWIQLTDHQQALLVKDALDFEALQNDGTSEAVKTILRRVRPASLLSYARTLEAQDKEIFE